MMYLQSATPISAGLACPTIAFQNAVAESRICRILEVFVAYCALATLPIGVSTSHQMRVAGRDTPSTPTTRTDSGPMLSAEGPASEGFANGRHCLCPRFRSHKLGLAVLLAGKCGDLSSDLGSFRNIPVEVGPCFAA